jgi:hypothetical protein
MIWQSLDEMLFLHYGRDSRTLSTCMIPIAEVTISAQGKITHADKMPPIGSWMRLMRGRQSNVGSISPYSLRLRPRYFTHYQTIPILSSLCHPLPQSLVSTSPSGKDTSWSLVIRPYERHLSHSYHCLCLTPEPHRHFSCSHFTNRRQQDNNCGDKRVM